MNMIFQQYKHIYQKYFDETNCKYVYGTVEKWLIVYKKTYFTKTNEDRPNIHNAMFAKYDANILTVKLIIDKLNPTVFLNELETLYFGEKVIHKVNSQFKPIENPIIFYKSYIVAYYTNLILYCDIKCDILMSYITWYDDGRRSSEGQYLNNNMHGNWIFWYNFVDHTKPSKKAFIAEYIHGKLIKKIEY